MTITAHTANRVAWLLALPLAVANYFWLAATDYWIADAMGGIQTLPYGWTQFGTIAWTWSCVFGIAFALLPPFGLPFLVLAGFSLARGSLGVLTHNPDRSGRYHWTLWAAILLWLVKVPVPLAFSLFYMICVQY